MKIIAIEAQHANAMAIEKRAANELWNEVKFMVIHSAVSKSASAGETVTFYGFPKAGNQQGSLAPRAAGIGSMPETVKVTTIDKLLFEHGYSRGQHRRQASGSTVSDETKVYLLKIDIEGFDGWALEGAKQHLLSRSFKWLLFEYNPKWKASSRTLRQVTAWLHDQFQYECFLIVPSAGLIPLYGQHWHPGYESWKWTNVFCGHKLDRDLVTLFKFLVEDVSSSAVMKNWIVSKESTKT